MELNALISERVHRVGGVGLTALRGGNVPGKCRAILPLVHCALVFDPVVLQPEVLVPGHVLQREEHRRLLDVRVLARAPLDGANRRVRAEPLAALVQVEVHRVGAVALYFVEAARGVVAVRDEEHVVRRPPVVEPVGPDAGHALFRHFNDVVLRQHPPLVRGDGVELVVVRAGTGGGVEQGLRFVQVVQDRRMPLEPELLDVFREGEHLAHAVTIVVVLDVLAPVHQGERAFARWALPVEGPVVDHLFLAVGLDDWRDHRDHVVANILDERRLFDDQTVRQLHQHVRATAFGGMHSAGEPVDRLAGGLDDLRRLQLGGFARIGEGGQVALVFLEVADGLLVADDEHRHVAPFFRLPDVDVPGAPRCRLGDRHQVLVHLVALLEHVPSAHDVAEVLERRRHSLRRGQMVDEVGQESRVARELLDELCVFLVLRLRLCLAEHAGRGGERQYSGDRNHGDARSCRGHSEHPASV